MSASSSAPVFPPGIPARRCVYRPHQRNLPRRSMESKPAWEYRLTMRSLTLSPGSSFLKRSAAFSGSKWPRAHWPCPRCVRGIAGNSFCLRCLARVARLAPVLRPAPGVAGETERPGLDGRPDLSAGTGRDQQKERQMALDTRSRSTWRLETSIRSWHAAWRVIAGLRDLGAGNVPDLDLNIGGSRSHTRNKARFAA